MKKLLLLLSLLLLLPTALLAGQKVTGDLTVTGNVGVGSINPTTTLDVNGTAKATVFQALTFSSSPAIYADNDANTGLLFTGPDTMELNTGGTTAITINSSQNIGIGTGAPLTKLDINGNVKLGSTNGEPHLIFRRPSNFNYIQIPSGASLGILPNGLSASAANSKFIMDSGGNIGIGTNVMNGVLSVYNAAANTSMTVRDQWGTYTLYGGDSFNEPFIQGYAASGSPTHLRLQPTSMNVGIGTFAPEAKLEVNGDIMAGEEGLVNIKSFGVSFDGGGSAITAGTKAYVRVPYKCAIQDWYLLGDVSGSLGVQVSKDLFTNYPPDFSTDLICGTECPTISSTTAASDTSLSSWTTTVTADDVIGFNVGVGTTITRANLTIKCKQ